MPGRSNEVPPVVDGCTGARSQQLGQILGAQVFYRMSDFERDVDESGFAVIAEHLVLIDRELATREVPLDDRPYRAALALVATAVIDVRDRTTGEAQRPDNIPELVSQPWFRGLFRTARQWYERRYGAAIAWDGGRALKGFVVLLGASFEIQVPSIISQPEIPGETASLEYPDEVRDGEDVLSWLVSPPVIANLPTEERSALTGNIRSISTRLRAINVAVLATGNRNDTLNGLLKAVGNHIEASAQKAVDASKSGLVLACWDLQMACECAFKALLSGRTSSFPRTHDLKRLWRLATPHMRRVPREGVDRMPASNAMISYRYGSGVRVTLDEYYKMYTCMLDIVQSAVEPLATMKLAKARITLAKPPWLR